MSVAIAHENGSDLAEATSLRHASVAPQTLAGSSGGLLDQRSKLGKVGADDLA